MYSAEQFVKILRSMGVDPEAYRQATAKEAGLPVEWMTFDFLANMVSQAALQEQEPLQAILIEGIWPVDDEESAVIFDGAAASPRLAALLKKHNVCEAKLRTVMADEVGVPEKYFSYSTLEQATLYGAAQEEQSFEEAVAKMCNEVSKDIDLSID